MKQKKTTQKYTFECMECGKIFKRSIPKSLEVRCPKCGSYDIELDVLPERHRSVTSMAVNH